MCKDKDGIVPIEVKSGRKRAKTLVNLLKKEEILKGYKLSSQNVGVNGKMLILPLYMAMLL